MSDHTGYELRTGIGEYVVLECTRGCSTEVATWYAVELGDLTAAAEEHTAAHHPEGSPCPGSRRAAVRRWTRDPDPVRVIACPRCGRLFPDLDHNKPGAPLPSHTEGGDA